jgi:hypothetical protein
LSLTAFFLHSNAQSKWAGIVASNKIESQADPEKTKNPADRMDIDVFIFTPVL